MSHAAALPALALRPYIGRYWMLRGSFSGEAQITLLPDGGAHLMLNLGEGVRSVGHGDLGKAESTLFVGPMLRSDQQLLAGEQHVVGVTFRPGAFLCFHGGASMSEAAGRVQSFDGAFPSVDTVRRFATIEELAPLLDRHYLDCLVAERASLSRILADVESRRGQVRIDELIRRHAITGRSLERYFAQQVGITPKEFIDLTRFKHALTTLERDRGRHTLLRVARDSGYYDGAHLTNAFKRFTGQPPSRFALSDLSKSASRSSDSVGA